MDELFSTGLIPRKKIHKEDGTYYTIAIGVANKSNLPKLLKEIVYFLRGKDYTSGRIKDLMISELSPPSYSLKVTLGSQAIHDYYNSVYACVASMLVDKEWFYRRILASGDKNIFIKTGDLFPAELDGYMERMSKNFMYRLWFTYARLFAKPGGTRGGYQNCSDYNHFDIPDDEAIEIAIISARMYIKHYIDVYPDIDTSYQYFGTDDIEKGDKDCWRRYPYSRILDTSNVLDKYIRLSKKILDGFKLTERIGYFNKQLSEISFDLFSKGELHERTELGAIYNMASICHIIAKAYLFERKRGDKNTRRKYARLMGFYIQHFYWGRNPNS